MKISIITVCLNSADTIEDTIKSVLRQKVEDLEYIIFDGGSTDNTIEIVKSYGEKVRLIQGTDTGIYDAINQGISASTGEVVGLLHSDDYYYHDNVLTQVMNEFQDPDLGAVYGDLEFVHRDDVSKIYRVWKTGVYSRKKILFGWTLPHPTLFVKRIEYDTHGLYNTDFKMAGDYELIIRLIYLNKIKCHYIPEMLVKMRNNGTGNGSLKKRLKVHQEDYRAWRVNHFRPPFFTVPLKPLRKILQYTKPVDVILNHVKK